MTEEHSFSDTKIAEHFVENIFVAELADDVAERAGSFLKFEGKKFMADVHS